MTRVLLAEDDRQVRESLVRVLEFEGYEVTAVNDGAAALEAFDRESPAALLLDVMMPFVDGLDVCRRLRARGDRTLAIGSEVEELSSLITELIELATDTRDDDVPFESVDLGDIVGQAVDRMRRRTDRDIDVESDASMVFGRPALLGFRCQSARRWCRGGVHAPPDGLISRRRTSPTPQTRRFARE